jgi:hypothetical protein
VDQDGTDSNTVVAAGFFDQQWQLDPSSTWHFPEPEPEPETEEVPPQAGP